MGSRPARRALEVFEYFFFLRGFYKRERSKGADKNGA